MNILIDFVHPADVNFYKNAVKILLGRGIGIISIVRPRGRLISVTRKELPYLDFKVLGKHYSNTFVKIFGLIKRDFELISYSNKIDFDVGTSFGSINLVHITRFLRKPSVLFGDDTEYRLAYYLGNFLAEWDVRPKLNPVRGKNLLKYNGFKELAYLHPNYFKPDRKVLEQYGITPNNYVFIRDVSRVSLNYKNMRQISLPEVIRSLDKSGLDVVLSLEDKTKAESLKDKCIILEEPVDDIFSLMNFALFTLSSGDTMARESCLVGTPTIYTGGRDMCVNAELIKKGCMFKVDEKLTLNDAIKNIIENDVKKETKRRIEDAIKYEWMDTTEVIINCLLSVIYKDDSLIEKYKSNIPI